MLASRLTHKVCLYHLSNVKPSSSSSIFLSEFLLVYSKNGPEYLTNGTALMFIALMRFLQQILDLRIFLVLLRYSYFFHLSPLVWWCPLPIFPSISSFTSLSASKCFLDFGSSIPSNVLSSHFLFSTWHIFLC